MQKNEIPLDNILMLIVFGIAGYIFADVVHEVIGHAGMCFVNGGKAELLTSVYFHCNLNNTLVDIGGPVANLITGFLIWIFLTYYKTISVNTRLFLLISMGFNLFWCAGGLIYSGIANVDDWSYLINGMQPEWLWRTILAVSGLVMYATVIGIITLKIRTFFSVDGNADRIKRLLLIPYISAGVAACTAALFYTENVFPAVKEAGLETFAASVGFLLIIRRFNTIKNGKPVNVNPVLRKNSWIILVAVIYIIFIVTLGHGVTSY